VSYIYCFVRTDIPLADQIVQAGHACLESGFAFEKKDLSNLVMLALKDDYHLCETKKYLIEHEIPHVEFWEPDENLGLSAICTQPLQDTDRKLFKKFHLWKTPDAILQAEK
jgi:hypothetical protein